MRLVDAEPYAGCRIVANAEDVGVRVDDLPTVDADAEKKVWALLAECDRRLSEENNALRDENLQLRLKLSEETEKRLDLLLKLEKIKEVDQLLKLEKIEEAGV